MKVKIMKQQEVEIKTILVKAEVRYWEDSEVNGEPDTENGDNIPCTVGDLWCPEIDIETGKILNWKQGVKAEIHYKVCDCFSYELKNKNGEVIFSKDYRYVPGFMCPKEVGYGDYIIMDIDENGQIVNWEFDVSDISDDFKNN